MKPACLKAKMKKTKQPDRAQAPQRGSNSPDACDNKDGNESSEKGGATHQISQNYNDKHDMEQNDSTDGVSKETASTDRTYERVALYMPYLTFGKCYRDDAKDGEADKNCRDKYQQLLDAYKEKIIHGSRTFDQFYYDSMSDMKGRDASQVVTRALTNHHSGDGIETEPWWPILAVDQLWLWVIDEETIVTCSTHRRDGLADPVVERIWNYLREKKGKGKGQPPPSSVDEMSRFIVNFCTSFVNETSWEASISGRPQGTCSVVETQSSRKSPREIFAETINKKADDEKEMFRGFKEKMRLKKDESEAQDQTHRTILNQQEETQNWQSISKAATVLNEVKDVLDELNILRAALMQQQSVWNELFKGGAELKSERAPTYTIQQIDEMTKITEAIQLSVKDILGLEQNGINIIEAFLSRGQAKESIQQGKTLMVFTVITIFFVPMSFLTSLFALNVSSFQHDPQNNLIYEPGWIFPIIFCTSIGLGLVIIFFAFYFDYARKTWNHFVKGGDGGGPVVSHTTSTTSLAQKAHGSVVSYSQPPEVLEKKSGGEGMWRLGFNQKRAPYHIV
ncbi:hypothetical protein ASPZODRAFT_206942 [Penicilliopsis zonata CBS 506.65]|uniref:Uncharacterized protein n=1 Tax=Penicilliopsis zonata CBS 506.65 TaxID=1073090 RepID=A0A1L9SU01_9EURO|nr:hypothetical protein ASPZODRAFT_206942 [Penicilliopsis zonata CBS 506.65]OJJ50553.1 hypothetical protein ASPZODRAFT_206942 [Penicilliopsis zonata CBS 506.65]